MKKNDIFDFNRFGKYLAADVKTCCTNYGLSLVTLPTLSFMALYVCHLLFYAIFNGEWNGPGIGYRGAVFVIMLICLMITMPVKCYGKVTDKKYGTFWLTLPASKLEKFLSMTILTCIAAPVVGTALYLILDTVICAIDPTCGNSLIHGIANIQPAIQEFLINEAEQEAAFLGNFFSQVFNPWLYIDDLIGTSLPFLLGALLFKNGKVVKTFLSLAGISMVFSTVASPLTMVWSNQITEMAETLSASEPTVEVMELIFDHWIFRNLALIDFISDTVFNLAILAGVFFRIKTIKH